jgi:hypothetical protein
MLEQGTIEEFKERVPDELFDRVDAMVLELSKRWVALALEAMREYAEVMHIEDQKEFALANTGIYRSECFMIRAERPIDSVTWRRVKEEYKGR